MTDIVIRNLSAAQIADIKNQMCTTTPPIDPPVDPNPDPPNVVKLGVMQFDGVRHQSVGMNPLTAYAYGIITIPAGTLGKQLQISVNEYGSASLWRQGKVSKVKGDFISGAGVGYNQGAGGFTTYLSVGTPMPGTLTVFPGEQYYVNVRNVDYFGKPDCKPGMDCNYQVTCYPPSS